MADIFSLLPEPLWQTLLMVGASTVVASILGLPLGVALFVMSPGGLHEIPSLRIVLDRIINSLRSFPFIILMILLFPLSRLIIGTSIGTAATVIPLSIAAAPFVARLVESALSQIDRGIIEAALVAGASKMRIIITVLIPEAAPALLAGLTLTIISLIGYSAMAGAIGGGGLGDLAIRYGYQRFRTDIMIASVVVILVLVEGIQYLGTRLCMRIQKNR